jgi:hypothetical protein
LTEDLLLATANLNSSKDNTLYESFFGTLSNGAGQHFFAGVNNVGGIRRGAIAFDLAGDIPPGSTIASAVLRLNMSKTASVSQTVSLHRILKDWGEGASVAPGNEGGGTDATLGDATWVYRFFDTENWTTAGGDFVPTASATRTVSGLGFYSWGSTSEMVADVQAWLDDPASNFGWLLLGNESADQTAKRFDSKEHPTAANRPVLIVGFLRRVYLPTVFKQP